MTNKEAIEKLVNAEFADKYQGDQDLTTAMHMAIDALESGPARHGQWIYKPAKGTFCSYCGTQSICKTNFCQTCGTKMKGCDDDG